MVKIRNIELGDFPLLLAPMEDVSDPPFRALCKQYGADLMYTEFISSEGLIRDAAKSVQKLDIFEYERPVGIQIFGSETESMVQSAQIIEAVKPDLIDINYGCPVKKVTCKGAGAGLLQDIPKMVRLTKEIVNATHLPVTVKTRLGWDEDTKNVVDAAERLQDIGIEAISIHGRTRKQMYKGYPWIFREIKHFVATGERMAGPTLAERVLACREHLLMSIRWKGPKLGIAEMKRHYTNYFKGISHFKEYRTRLVTTAELDEILSILSYIEEHQDEFIFA
jgi:tRNA-dihydrouridine synthase